MADAKKGSTGRNAREPRSYSASAGKPAAISLQVVCEDQAEVDRYTAALNAHPASEQSGWVKDRYGLSWQLVPRRLNELLADPDRTRAKRVMDAMMDMTKIDIAAIDRAAAC